MIFGRNQEVRLFDQLCRANEAQFIAIYGRRRIGKTFLISQYFQNKGLYFELTGIKKAPLAIQLENFAVVLADVFFAGHAQITPASWSDALTQLRRLIEKVPKTQKAILFFDELPWLASPRSGFMAALDHFWNRYLSRMSNVILIVCGSAASWMLDHVIYDRSGLYGRLTKEIKLSPFDLTESADFLKFRGISLTQKQFIEIYMAMGGVAKYLTQVKKGKSSAQVINDICFNQNGYLLKEFNKLYRSLFDHYEHHIKIVRLLAKTRSGLSRDEILKQTGLTSGGTSTKMLKELEEAGFIIAVPSMNNNTSTTKYQLIDFYSLFYLRWIEDRSLKSISSSDHDYWLKQHGTPGWYAWAGHVFENICMQHVSKICAALGLAGVTTTASTWRYQKKAADDLGGAQIDLVIERADNCINLVEIKFSEGEFVIDKAYAKKLMHKKHCYRMITNTKKALFLTMITTYGVKENPYFHQAVDNQLTMADLF